MMLFKKSLFTCGRSRTLRSAMRATKMFAPGFRMLPVAMISAAGFGMLSMAQGCASTEAGGTRYADTYLIYSAGGGMDIYEDGNRYGQKLEINTDAGYRIYHRIYREGEESGNEESRTIRDELVKQGELDPERLDSLRSLIDESDFFSFPNRLPDVSPLEVEHRTPAETITITIRKEDGSMHRVQSYMGVDLRHYPEDYLEIHRFLRDWYRELVVE